MKPTWLPLRLDPCRCRFLVAAVVLLCTPALLSCDGFRSRRPDRIVADINQGNADLAQTQVIERELGEKYAVSLVDQRGPSGRMLTAQLLAQSYPWRRLNKSERMAVKERLSQYVSLSSEVLKIDARKGVYVTNKNEVIRRRDGAIEFLRAAEEFERVHGENFDPSRRSA